MIFTRFMRRVLVIICLMIIFSPLVSAETYLISGKATYADNSPVALEYVTVECEQGNFDCYQHRGTRVMTNAYGDFTLMIDVENEDNGLDIFLSLRGENFSHVINLDGMGDSGQKSVAQDIKLAQYPPPSGVFMGFGCVIVLFVLVFVSVLLRTGRRLTTKQGRLEFMGYRPAKELQCPKCDETVVQHELIKHLIVEHDMDPQDAGELTGKVMRQTWSEEE